MSKQYLIEKNKLYTVQDLETKQRTYSFNNSDEFKSYKQIKLDNNDKNNKLHCWKKPRNDFKKSSMQIPKKKQELSLWQILGCVSR